MPPQPYEEVGCNGGWSEEGSLDIHLLCTGDPNMDSESWADVEIASD
jgi:hypothetical protein